MSFGGSAQAANQSLRYNRSLRRGHKTFEKLKEQYENRIEYHQKVHHKDVSPEDLARIKAEVKVWAQKRRRKQNLVLAAVIILLFGAMYFVYYVNQPDYISRQTDHALFEQRHEKQIHEKFSFYADDAQFMMIQEKYHNASFQYQKAIDLVPGNTSANVGLVISLSKLCVEEERRCNEVDIVFEKSYKRVVDKDLFLDELFRLSLSTDAETKALLQGFVGSAIDKS